MRPGPELETELTLTPDLADYHSPRWRRHNARRLEFLASLSLPIADRTVLELGAGIGDHSSFFLDRGCRLTAVEGRAAAFNVLHQRFASNAFTALLLDLDPPPLERPGTFEVVVCLGLLYHLARPADLLAWAAEITSDLLILETIVHPSEVDADPVPWSEDAALPGASIRGTGSRPTRQWVWRHLSDSLPFVYATVPQVAHYEFPTVWGTPHPYASRAFFVGSRRELRNPALCAELPDSHRNV